LIAGATVLATTIRPKPDAARQPDVSSTEGAFEEFRRRQLTEGRKL
jgi:hypothetical protein